MSRRLFAALAALLLLTAACGGGENESSGPQDGNGGDAGEADGNTGDAGDTDGADDELTRVRVLHSMNSEQLAIFVAYEAGFFTEEGLDVEMREAGSAGQITPAVAGGTGDLGLSTASDLILAISEGLDLVVGTGTSVNTPENPRLFLMAGADSGITTGADLTGKRVAVPSRGSFAELGAAMLMSRDGVDPESVSWVEMPFPQMNDSLAAGRVDAAVAVVPFTSLMASEGHLQLLDFSDLGGSVIIAVLSARRDWAESNPEALAAFKRALDRAAELIEEDPEFAKEVEAQYTGLPPEVVAQIPFGNYRSEATQAEVQLWVEILQDQGLIGPELSADDILPGD